MRKFLFGTVVLLAVFLAISPAYAQKKVCRIWFWGEDEAVGITDWMKENAALYNKAHPEVEWQVTHIQIDAIFTGFKAAVEAKDAPDLHTAWGGMSNLTYAWTGEIVPMGDYISKSTIAHLFPAEIDSSYMNGKLWAVGLYLDPWYLIVNKKVWKDSGNDPNKLPSNWTDFIAALKKVKAAGYTPFVAGMKDGYFGDFLHSVFQHEYYNNSDEYHKAILGQESLANAPHDRWWYNVEDLRKNGLLNKDASSLTLGEVIDTFSKGKAAVTSGVQPQAVIAQKALGADNIAVMVAPVNSTAKLNGYLPIPSNALVIPAVAKNKVEAGKFIDFLLSPERQAALYEKTGVMPSTDYLPESAMKTEVDRTTLRLVKTKSTFTMQEHTPPILLESMYALCQELISGDIDAKTAAQKFEAAAVKWRKENPKDVENYRKWVPQAK